MGLLTASVESAIIEVDFSVPLLDLVERSWLTSVPERIRQEGDREECTSRRQTKVLLQDVSDEEEGVCALDLLRNVPPGTKGANLRTCLFLAKARPKLLHLASHERYKSLLALGSLLPYTTEDVRKTCMEAMCIRRGAEAEFRIGIRPLTRRIGKGVLAVYEC